MPCGRRCGQSGFQRRQRCLPAPPRVTVPGRHQATVGARGTDGRVAEQTGFWRLILCHARVGGTRERSWAPPACGGRKRGERLPGAGSPPAFVNLQEPCHPVGGRGGLSRLWRLSGCGCTLTPPPPPPQGRAHRRAAGRAGGRQPGHEADHHRDAGAGPGPGESRLRAHLQGYRGS